MLKLIFLPGLDGTGKLFEPLIDKLGGQFNIQTIQFPTDICLSYDELVPLVQSAIPQAEPFVLIAE